MSSTIDHVLTAALPLSDGDRVELVEALIASLQPGDRPPPDDSWREVIRRRSDELRSGKVTPVPWNEVRDAAREKASTGRVDTGSIRN
jgi:putative addiction module component (TIGR02574 family)